MPNYKQDMALSLIVNQLTESPNYKAIIRAIARTYDDQGAVLEYIGKLDVMTARGVWLDLIGSIAGIGRRVDIDLRYRYFGYKDLRPTASGYGVGRYGYYGAPDDVSNLLGDDEYRRVILAKASYNNAINNNHIDIVECMQLVLQTDEVYSWNGGKAKVDLMFDATLSDNMKELIVDGKIVPTSAGVGLRRLIEFDSENSFGYANLTSKAKGYGTGRYPRRIA